MSKIRIFAGALALSAAGLIGIAEREGYTDNAIIPIKGDVPTIGFGETRGVKMGDKTTPLRALIVLRDGMGEYESAVQECAGVPMYQAEFDLWVKFTYNIGASAFCKSTMAKKLKAGDYKGACDAILLYKKAGKHDCSVPGNRICPGLWRDRLQAHAECLSLAGQ